MEFDTERLTMRKLTHGDTDTVYAMLKKPAVSQYLFIESQTDIFKTRNWMALYIDNPENHSFAMLKKATGEFVGVIALKRFKGDPKNHELTLFVDPKYWNKGYVDEVFACLRGYAREKLEISILTTGVQALNKAGNLALRKQGFEFVGVQYPSNCPQGVNFYQDILQPQADENAIQIGRYQHFKGNEYRVLSVARHSETLEEMVVYQALYGDRGVWVRPARMWNEKVMWKGKQVRRFTYLGT